MLKIILQPIKTSLTLLIIFTILTGIIYPAVVTGIAQLLFYSQANGSIIEVNNKQIGSLLIGQQFTDIKYFWGRPSATSPMPYNGASSTGSNMGPLNPTFLTLVEKRIAVLRQSDPQKNPFVPIDLITASASGLDPDISPLAAFFQIPRIAKARNIPEKELQTLVQNQIKIGIFGLLTEARVNVLQLNIALDRLRKPNNVRTTP